ncbi:hypothetical protein DWU98_11570 [Dyella monticola]|uniref:Uncharacterized protein n=1 Tax=Dyella monticola TaxID=1927958 RepID=A0A370WYR1_9GAMM|nr:hypothetical protein DWU98_11570 [Dyella monticola]
MSFTACAGSASAAHTQRGASNAVTSSQLAIQVNDDRITLSMARVPQIYLYGPIDVDAPQRFEALVNSGRIRPGSDIYLNSPGGSVTAGMALGRLFRQGGMITHLGMPRLPKGAANVNRSAICEGACAYAYLGGLYRWAASGSDRIGFPTYAAQRAPEDVSAYLKDMGINDDALAAATSGTSPDPVLWPNADTMIAKGLANNGRQDLVATYSFSQGAPQLELKQIDRNGTHSITLLCKQAGAELTTYDTIGAVRARSIVGREEHSYFEINQQEVLPQQRGAMAVDESVVIHRIYPLNQLPRVASAQAMGAWVKDRNGIRFGFAFEVGGVRKILNDFTNACVNEAQAHS